MDSPSHAVSFDFSPTGPTRAVRLCTFMPRFASPLEFTPRDGTWRLEVELPVDARLEYRIEFEDERGTHSVLDPANPRTAANPFGENSVHVGPAYRYEDWTTGPESGGDTREVRVHSEHLGGRRHHVLYSAAGLDPATPAPLLVVHDGSDYIRYAGLPACLEAMIAAGRIPPLRVLGLNPRVRHQRYIASDQHADHVVDEAIPHIHERVSVSGQTAIMGASLGAVAAWHTAWRHPGCFTGLVLQSGTFALDPHPQLDEPMYRSISRFLEMALEEPRTDEMTVMQSCGRWESLIEWNRTVARTLSLRSASHRFIETWTGHDWGAWSGTMDIGIEMAFGP